MSDVELERRIAAALHTPVSLGDGARDRIMRCVRESARSGRPRRRVLPLSMRPARHSIVGLAMAASIGSVAVLSAVGPHSPALHGERPSMSGDSVVGTLRDTLLLMRLIHEGEHRYAFVVDGARWAPERAISPARAEDRLAPMLRAARDSN
jgi:hypothetical protein